MKDILKDAKGSFMENEEDTEMPLQDFNENSNKFNNDYQI